MIESIKLERFRCFENVTLPFRDINVIVGKNNAGKSTIVEALRIVSLVASKFTKSIYEIAPNDLKLSLYTKVLIPSVKYLDIDLRTIIYRYGKPPAKITVTFSTKDKFIIYITEERIYAQVLDSDDNQITTRNQAQRLEIHDVRILPQIVPLQREEPRVSVDTVLGTMNSHLSSRHFRNEVFYFKEQYFDKFVQLAEGSWPGLKVRKIEIDPFSANPLLMVADGDFAAEIGWMGSGIQMWLQLMWFLAKTSKESCIILDEPDVFMHADLQRRVVMLLRRKYHQTVLATHSTEIMSLVDPCNILLVDKDSRTVKFTSDINAVQQIMDAIGSSYNVQLVRLGQSRRCIFTEGDDISILELFHWKLNPDNQDAISTIPNIKVGGFSNIQRVIGTCDTFSNTTNDSILVYCILDKDYHIESELNDVRNKMIRSMLSLHIWNKKEIENYLIVPNAIFRLVSRLSDSVDMMVFMAELNELVDTFKDDVYDNYASSIMRYKREQRIDLKTANAEARAYLNDKWVSLDSKISLAPGKALLGKIFDWIKTKYKVQITKRLIVDEMLNDEISNEIRDVVNSIVAAKPFPAIE